MKKFAFILIFVVLVTSTIVFAQRTTDIKGGKDYPLVSRFDGSVIEFYKEVKWETYKLPVFKNDASKPNYKNPLKLEGKIIRIQYSVAPDNNPAYIMKNYEKAFKQAGYKILLEGKPGTDFKMNQAGFSGEFYGDWENLNLGRFGFAYEPIGNHTAIIVAKTNKAGNDIYIVDVISDFSNTTLITQDVVEVEAAETGAVTAKSLEEGLASAGHIALEGVYFNTGKSTLKPESESTLKNIADYLNTNKDKKFFIVGHTDNAGSFQSNKNLSEDRAKSVMNELVTKYKVNADQLKSYGVANLAPATSNATDKGKAKNRRVEIVEQ